MGEWTCILEKPFWVREFCRDLARLVHYYCGVAELGALDLLGTRWFLFRDFVEPVPFMAARRFMTVWRRWVS